MSLFDPQESGDWLNHDIIDVIQTPYNYLKRDLEGVLGQFKDSGKGLLVREVFHYGFFKGKYDATHEFPENDHRNQFSKEALEDILCKITQLKDDLGFSSDELFESCIPFALSPDKESYHPDLSRRKTETSKP